MRDTIKPEGYFLEKLRSDRARIQKFQALVGNAPDGDGSRVGKLQLSLLYRGCVKASFSLGAGPDEVYSDYLPLVNYYSQVCTPADSAYDIVDLLSLGVLFQARKGEFLPALETMAEKFGSRDGLILCLLGHLQDRPLEARPSRFGYFDRLVESEDKKAVLSLELSQWYQHHKGASWYDSHKSKNNTYRGYWCFEIAALSKIFGIDDGEFRSHPYYPYDLAHAR